VDGTRARRTRDKARQAWYARHRQRRFARFLGFDDNPRHTASPPTAGAGARFTHMSTVAKITARAGALPARAIHDVVAELDPLSF
jgi:hypothetical protein